jgi:hypothetical protein
MTLRYNATLRNAQATAIATEAGSGALIKIYVGAVNGAGVGTAPAGALLGTLTVSGTFGTATGGVLTFGTVTSDTSADASGTAGCFRITKSDGTTGVLDGTVTATGGGGDMTLNTTTVTAGGTIAISSGTITVGNA